MPELPSGSGVPALPAGNGVPELPSGSGVPALPAGIAVGVAGIVVGVADAGAGVGVSLVVVSDEPEDDGDVPVLYDDPLPPDPVAAGAGGACSQSSCSPSPLL